MQTTLPKELRRKLEAAIVKARDIAESAARTELQRLAVGEKTAASCVHMAASWGIGVNLMVSKP
jgi:hypothetical protein